MISPLNRSLWMFGFKVLLYVVLFDISLKKRNKLKIFPLLFWSVIVILQTYRTVDHVEYERIWPSNVSELYCSETFEHAQTTMFMERLGTVSDRNGWNSRQFTVRSNWKINCTILLLAFSLYKGFLKVENFELHNSKDSLSSQARL